MEIKKILDTEKLYPYMLKQIEDRPIKLYTLGDINNLHKKCIAIVGTRNCSSYGAEVAEKIAYILALKGNVIVSGLAKGIDTHAHIGALKAKGKTIAVLGHGLNTIYPSQNKNLAKQIIYNGGTIITEYDVKDKIERRNFQQRNRIISGLSTDVIIVEAKEKSGSLITANYALEQGRNIYAVPGDITNKNSMGTNKLIMNGAEILTL